MVWCLKLKNYLYVLEAKMIINSTQDLGSIIKKKRKEDGITLHNAAAICGVSHVFLSALENGKETVRFDKVLQVTACLGIEIYAYTKGWETKDGVNDL
jgi:HTH-type transcriptional regulator/antitoxin HipB